jgi:hypothetical protein
MTTERAARKISEFIEYECDQHDGVNTPPEEEYPGTPVNDDSGDDAQPTPVESPTKRARSTTNVAPESVDVGTATIVPPPSSQPPAPTGATTTMPNLRLKMTHKLIEKAFFQQAFEIPTKISLADVQTIGKTTKVGTYNLTKGTNQCDSFAVVARVVPDPFTGMQHSASPFVLHRTRHHCDLTQYLAMPMSMRTLHHTHVISHTSSAHRMTSVDAGEFPNSTVPITGEPKYTDAAVVYFQPVTMEQVDPYNRFDRDATIAFIKDVMKMHAEAASDHGADYLVNSAAKHWNMSPNDPRFPKHPSTLRSQPTHLSTLC